MRLSSVCMLVVVLRNIHFDLMYARRVSFYNRTFFESKVYLIGRGSLHPLVVVASL